MTPPQFRPALAISDDVITLAMVLGRLAEKLHATLRRLTAERSTDTTITYALLTEEYALRARINILQNDARRHALSDLDFSQGALIEALDNIELRLGSASSLEGIQLIVSDLITFAAAICPGKAKAVNFLAKELGVRG